jgi:hypothetical protein
MMLDRPTRGGMHEVTRGGARAAFPGARPAAGGQPPARPAAGYDPAQLGLQPDDVALVNDDRVGRVLEALFDADRASQFTEVVLAAVREFDKMRCTGQQRPGYAGAQTGCR